MVCSEKLVLSSQRFRVGLHHEFAMGTSILIIEHCHFYAVLEAALYGGRIPICTLLQYSSFHFVSVMLI